MYPIQYVIVVGGVMLGVDGDLQGPYVASVWLNANNLILHDQLDVLYLRLQFLFNEWFSADTQLLTAPNSASVSEHYVF
jgi:hypothetical protein